MMRILKYYLFVLLLWLSLLVPISSLGENIVESEQLTYDQNGQRLLFRSTGISNSGECTTVCFNIECQDLPFTIDSLQIVVCDTVYSSFRRFSLTGTDKNVRHQRYLWRVKSEFPQLYTFSDDDILRLFSSEGQFDIPLHPMAIAASDVSLLQNELTKLQTAYSRQTMWMWCLSLFAFICVLSAFAYIVIKTRRNNNVIQAEKKQVEAERLKIIGAESKTTDDKKNLMRKGFEVFNLLCNEYFEKSGAELTKATLVKDLEEVILSFKTEKTMEELRQLVDVNMNGILSKIKKELPAISESDVQFLTYLYAGFSPRAVCIMTDSKLKNFYNRRTRLKEKILAIDAPHREWFASEM